MGVESAWRQSRASILPHFSDSTRVNRTENDDPECAQEVPILGTAQMLFWESLSNRCTAGDAGVLSSWRITAKNSKLLITIWISVF